MAHMFGTDGIRDRFGTNWLTPRGIYAIGHAIAQWVQAHDQCVSIAIARDTRASQDAIIAALTSALYLYPYDITDYHTIPTPALVALMQEQAHNGGIMITASHNHAQDNGIKIFGPHGKKLSSEDEQIIHDYAQHAYTDPTSYEQATAYHFAKTHHATTAPSMYRNIVRQRVWPNLSGLHVSIDTAAGAAHYTAPAILRACGADVTTISPEPDGYNINAEYGSTAPEHLQEHVTTYKTDIGFAFDGDGDRLIAVSSDGTVRDGDDILALLSQHPAYRDELIVSTVMSNMGLEEMLQADNKALIRTSVGDTHVAHELSQRGLYLGGEPSGHIILRDIHSTGDGVLTALRLLETIMYTGNWHMQSFSRYTQLQYKIHAPVRVSLEETELHTILYREQQAIHGRLHARYSGTEPVLRLMVESKDADEARAVGIRTRNAIAAQLKEYYEQQT